ncbi:Dynein regulatory complex subunit 7 [Frankliniella fusca]|uniref:Dynein regulatory complex subunit 7 n=1 Tax=Frankliniella fusca TaxID=407009 RepID=A0AAE1L8Y8_9NEOP|nr:Dynein regulatory complex subunit 7 [Frankliniella fusca]
MMYKNYAFALPVLCHAMTDNNSKCPVLWYMVAFQTNDWAPPDRMTGQWEVEARQDDRGGEKQKEKFLRKTDVRVVVLQPAALVSPWTVLERQSAHCFELATLLVSLLIGAGYDAYVVSGTATREVCNNDQLRVVCPELVPKPEVVEEPRAATPPKYQVRPPPYLHSRFMEQMAERERRRELDRQREEQEEEDRRIAELEKPAPDELRGFRLHAWALVRADPARGVDEHFFLEPSTGFRHDIAHPGYHRVESVWNHVNYWVNVQEAVGRPRAPDDTCEGTDFDLTDLGKWEHLLAGEPAEWRQGPDPAAAAPDLDEQTADEDVLAEKHLDMPASWVPRLDVQNAVYEKRYPGCNKTILYKKAKVEKFAPYLNKDGLVRRVTVYADYEHGEPLSLTEHYENRADCLERVQRNLENGSATDFFRRGRDDACKEHQYVVADNSLDSVRLLRFYDVARYDGLEELEMGAEQLTETFRRRSDRLQHRRVHFLGPDPEAEDQDLASGQRRPILKIIEKFERNPEVDANRDIAERQFLLNENKILLKFHYGMGKLTAATREFTKPAKADRGRWLNFNADLVTSYEAGGKPLKQVELLELLQEQLDAEEKTLFHLSNFLRMRVVEVALPRLQVSLFDEERNEMAKKGLREREQRLLEEEAREVEAEVDFLAPYMARLGNPDGLSPSQALAMRDDCLNDFKQQYVSRAQQMQQRFETEKERLQELNRWYEENQEKLSPEQEDKHLMETQRINFLLHTLQIRLERHRDLAPQRYLALEACLRADPRLSVLY